MSLSAAPLITAADLQGKAFAPVRWVVPEMIPEGLTILAGKPKLGKSWLILDVALAAAQGGWTLGDRHCIEGDVLYAALEDGQRRLKERMRKVCNTKAWPSRLTFCTEMSSLNEGGADFLREWIAQATDPRLIIIDTFAKVRPTSSKTDTQYESDYRATGALKAIADQTGVAIVIVHHVRKMGADDPFDTVSGTNGLTGAADTIIVLQRDGGGVVLHARGRDIEEMELAIQFQKDTCRWRVLGAAHEVRRSAERTAILVALKASDEPMTPLEISDVTGHARIATRKLLLGMARDGEVVKHGKGKYRPS